VAAGHRLGFWVRRLQGQAERNKSPSTIPAGRRSVAEFSVRGRGVMRGLPAHLRSFLNRWCLGPPAQAGG